MGRAAGWGRKSDQTCLLVGSQLAGMDPYNRANPSSAAGVFGGSQRFAQVGGSLERSLDYSSFRKLVPHQHVSTPSFLTPPVLGGSERSFGPALFFGWVLSNDSSASAGHRSRIPPRRRRVPIIVSPLRVRYAARGLLGGELLGIEAG